MIYKTNPLIDIYLYFSFTSQYTFRNSYQHKIYAMFSNISFSLWLQLDICSFLGDLEKLILVSTMMNC